MGVPTLNSIWVHHLASMHNLFGQEIPIPSTWKAKDQLQLNASSSPPLCWAWPPQRTSSLTADRAIRKEPWVLYNKLWHLASYSPYLTHRLIHLEKKKLSSGPPTIRQTKSSEVKSGRTFRKGNQIFGSSEPRTWVTEIEDQKSITGTAVTWNGSKGYNSSY